tara:strand:+ start:4883 stop:5782 length:900 start_codon:yes stop_codon:yes gene_type:complete
MKLLFENWRKYLKEIDEPTSHPLPAHLQSIPGAWGKFKAGVDELIKNFQDRDKLVNDLWDLYETSDVTTLQASQMMNDAMDEHNLPDDIDDAVLDFTLKLTGPQGARAEGSQENEEVPAIVTFDFDDTISLSHWGEEEDDWVHDGPHQEMIDILMDYHKKGSNIYIVTSRHKEMQDEDGNWYSLHRKRTPSKKYFKEFQTPVWEFVKKNGLPIQDVIFTNGQIKAKAENGLIELGSEVHHDDDPEEIHAAQQAGIKTTISDPYPHERQEKWEGATGEREKEADEMKARITAHQQRQKEK